MSSVQSSLRWGYPSSSNYQVPITISVRTRDELLNLRALEDLATFDEAIHLLAKRDLERQATPKPVPRVTIDRRLRVLCGAQRKAVVNGHVRQIACRLFPTHVSIHGQRKHRWWSRDGSSVEWYELRV